MHDSKDVTSPPATDSNSSAALRLEGSIERVIYHEPRTGYGVYRVLIEAETESVVVVAKGRRREVGATVQATGTWTRHPTHGRQFDALDLREVESKAPEAVFRRLIQYPGIGEQTAQRILETLGVDALDQLSTRPNSWLTVDGIGERTLARVLEYHRTRSGPLAALEDRLVAADLPIRFAEMLHRQYGEQIGRAHV